MTGDHAPAWKRNLPNQLTGLRIVLAAAFVALLSIYLHRATGWKGDPSIPLAALVLFVVAALTDALDGHLARKWNVVSVFGRIADPFADKILVLGAFVMLCGPAFQFVRINGDRVQASGVLPWMVVVILARDLLVTTLRALVEGRGQSFAAIGAGKLKMLVQSVGAPVILLVVWLDALRRHDPAPTPYASIAAVAAWIVTLVTAWSAVPYVVKGAAMLREPARG
ncbi:MAG: CDP-alcohol phosphatidyltransferase family protein [Phycisphaerales bacterium]|nr:CDP-alcohol phosphatidyltransferase family protein [Phycisphaerales bacterium]